MRFRLVSLLFAAAACCSGQGSQPTSQPYQLAPGVRRLGTLAGDRITESSGVVASRRHPGVFWTHNDGRGGKRAPLCAFDMQGKELAEFQVQGAKFTDWEDLAQDQDGHLFCGDIGDNDGTREHIAVHQIDEPDPAARRGTVRVRQSWQLRFPDRPQDCEGLFVWRGHGHVVTKTARRGPAAVWRFSLAPSATPVMLEHVVTLPVDAPVTGAAISDDGQSLAVVSGAGAWWFDIAGDVAAATKCPRRRVRFAHDSIEGCCFVPEALLVTAESRDLLLFDRAAFRD